MSSLAYVEPERGVEPHCFFYDVAKKWELLELVRSRRVMKTDTILMVSKASSIS